LFPSLLDIGKALVDGVLRMQMLAAALHTLILIGRGLLIGATIALAG